jgi:dethiobiotin synthetase
VPLYDQYDDANDRTTIMCLLDSLAPGLANTIEKKHLQIRFICFHVYDLLQTIQSTLIEVYGLLEKLIKDSNPTQ